MGRLGSLGRRLEALEASSKDRAAAAVADLMGKLEDEEVALLAVHASGAELTPEQEERRRSAEAKLRDAGIDRLLDLAVRPKECASEKDLDRRVRELNALWLPGGSPRRARLWHLVRSLQGDSRSVAPPGTSRDLPGEDTTDREDEVE